MSVARYISRRMLRLAVRDNTFAPIRFTSKCHTFRNWFTGQVWRLAVLPVHRTGPSKFYHLPTDEKILGIYYIIMQLSYFTGMYTIVWYIYHSSAYSYKGQISQNEVIKPFQLQVQDYTEPFTKYII